MRDRAAYMREYRAKRRQGPIIPSGVLIDGLAEYQREIAALTAEVARLKRELAARPIAAAPATGPKTAHLIRRYPEFRPVPKPSQRK